MILTEEFIAEDGLRVEFTYTDDHPGVAVSVVDPEGEQLLQLALTVPSFKRFCKAALRLDEQVSRVTS